MTWEHRGELRADPGIAPGDRNIDPPRRRSFWSSIAVVAAIAAFGGVIWYAYHTGKDANRSGIPPLVKAETGPVKVKPENPGGQEIPFQDSTVYDHLDKNGQKQVVEKLLPPPEEPVARPQPVPPPADAPIAAATEPVPPPVAPQAAVSAPLTDAGAPTALAPTPGAIVIQPVAVAPPRPAVAPPAPKPEVAAMSKPEAAKPAPPTDIAALIAGAGAATPAPKTSSAGGFYRLQLSAVRSPAAVPEEWARLKRRFPELASLRSSTNKIDVPGKGTFYRVEAGPLDEAAAKSTCTRLRGQGLGCIVVKH
jgi:hypothetical protein